MFIIAIAWESTAAVRKAFGILFFFRQRAQTSSEVKPMKEDEKKPRPWEAVDPKPPVVQSGHLESKAQK